MRRDSFFRVGRRCFFLVVKFFNADSLVARYSAGKGCSFNGSSAEGERKIGERFVDGGRSIMTENDYFFVEMLKPVLLRNKNAAWQ